MLVVEHNHLCLNLTGLQYLLGHRNEKGVCTVELSINFINAAGDYKVIVERNWAFFAIASNWLEWGLYEICFYHFVTDDSFVSWLKVHSIELLFLAAALDWDSQQRFWVKWANELKMDGLWALLGLDKLFEATVIDVYFCFEDSLLELASIIGVLQTWSADIAFFDPYLKVLRIRTIYNKIQILIFMQFDEIFEA